MLLTVDRIEENIVVLIDDDKNIYEYQISLFAESPREGDVFELTYDGDTPVFKSKPDIKEERSEKIKSRFARLLKK